MPKVIDAAVQGLITGTRGAADGIRNGWQQGSQSVAGRPGMAWAKGVAGGIRGTVEGVRVGWNKHRQHE